MHQGLSQSILPRPVLQLSSHKTEALRSDRVHSPVIHLCHNRGGISPGSGDAETPAHTPVTPWDVGHTHHPQSGHSPLPGALPSSSGFLLPDVCSDPGDRQSPNSPPLPCLKLVTGLFPAVFGKSQPPQGAIRGPLQTLVCPSLQTPFCSPAKSYFS